MKSLTVLYDADCGLCVGCKRWVQQQGTYFPVHFLAQGGDTSAQRYPMLVSDGPAEELIAIGSNGEVYRDDKAWLMVLYALRRYRPMAMRLARPGMRGLARRAYYWVSRRRHSISRKLGVMPDRELHRYLRDQPEPRACRIAECVRHTGKLVNYGEATATTCNTEQEQHTQLSSTGME